VFRLFGYEYFEVLCSQILFTCSGRNIGSYLLITIFGGFFGSILCLFNHLRSLRVTVTVDTDKKERDPSSPGHSQLISLYFLDAKEENNYGKKGYKLYYHAMSSVWDYFYATGYLGVY
jgi:hypothetical protein